MINSMRRYAIYVLFFGLCVHGGIHAAQELSLWDRTASVAKRYGIPVLTLAALVSGYLYDRQLRHEREDEREGKQEQHFGKIHTAHRALDQQVTTGFKTTYQGQREIKKATHSARAMVLQHIAAQEKARRNDHKELTGAIATGFDGLGTRLNLVDSAFADAAELAEERYEHAQDWRNSVDTRDAQNAELVRKAQQEAQRRAQSLDKVLGMISNISNSSREQLERSYGQAAAELQAVEANLARLREAPQTEEIQHIQMQLEYGRQQIQEHMSYLEGHARSHFPQSRLGSTY